MADGVPASNLLALSGAGEVEGGELGNRLTDRSSETRSILALASPRTHLFGLPESLLPPPPTDPAPPLNATAAQDMNRASKPSTPRPEVPGASPAHRSPEVPRPLNVTDALSYLDAVKNQFQDSPDVYNQFLDIMKDFKSQVIDTPGVIDRVANLFHGNPYLIQGFNTFLPVGYRIDISADPSNPNSITVTTPLGTTTQNTGANAMIPRTGREMPAMPSPAHLNQGLYPAANPLPPNAVVGPASRSMTPHGYQVAHPPPFEPLYSPGMQHTADAASFLHNLNNKGQVDAPGGEFNHAIQYLNKIKARYADDQVTYKRFLDILQTYQKEQRHSQDSQVYVSVQVLFKDAPDLLAEFKDFLPDAVPGGVSGPPMMPQPGPGVWGQGEPSPPNVAKKPVQTNKRSRKRVPEKEATPVPLPKPVTSRQAKKVKHHHNQDNEPASFSPYVVPHSPPQNHAYPPSQMPPPPHPHAAHVHLGHHDYQTRDPSAGKLLFFDRAKKSLENRELYEEFLKLLNLFSKDIIDVATLIDRSRAFLGEGDLMAEFKDLMGWDERDKLEKGPPGSIRTGPPEMPFALPVDDGEGPSYRRLPPSEVDLACSGRDELCRSVLNDEWVSHPTWASEESGFVSHKKTVFEEALHKSEEERHEYHVQLQALTRTIAVLEPINSRIDEMTNEERAGFRLKADFGGYSPALYHRIIKKIYGRDMGMEVIQALQDCPTVAVPVVLHRLKMRDEEWRRAQREWSRTWKEVDSRNFYKSLDHQGINFKANDKKNITAKHFVADILAVKKQQLKKWERKGVKPFVRGPLGHQLEHSFKNTTVLHDSLKMVYSFLEHSHSPYSPQERRAVEKFLRAFVPTLCMCSEAEFNAGAALDGSCDDDSASVHEPPSQPEGGGSRSGRRSTGTPHSVQSGGIPANDLRKKLLKTAQEKALNKKDLRGAPSTIGSRAASPHSGHRSPRPPRPEEEPLDPHDVWIKEASPSSSSNGNSSTTESFVSGGHDKERPFFANTTFYTLLRLLELLYSRLLMCHEIGAQYAAQKHAPLLANRVAVDLGLDDPNGPASVLAQTMDHLGKPLAEDTNVVYMYLLTACEKYFDNELDQATFEEHMRWFFGTKAYTLSTLDKLITALIKQAQTILSDHKCQELWSLLKSAQNSKNITSQDIIRYRREAERHVGQDDHLYRLQWVRESRCIRVSLCSPDEPSCMTDGSATSRWREYVSTYVMTHPTEWLPEPRKGSSPVFLRRCARMGEEGTSAVVEDHMKIRVSVPTYKLVYEAGCEDLLWHEWGKDAGEMAGRARAREEERRRSKCVGPEKEGTVGCLLVFGLGETWVNPGLLVTVSLFSTRLARHRPLSSSPSQPSSVPPAPRLHPQRPPPRPLPSSRTKTFAGLQVQDLLGTAESSAPCNIMAKPLSVASTDGASSSKSHRCTAQHTPESPHRPRHRRHRSSKASPSTLGPSSGLLSILATIASASTSYASPAPPPFLCPSIQSQENIDRPLSKRASSSTNGRFSNSAILPANVRRHVPAKFEKGADGVWRRVESYTLYGSTVPSGCTGPDCRLPTNAVSAIDDQIQVGGNLNTSNTTTTPYDIRDELPPGWKPTVRPYEGRTTLILAMSLVLACFICFFIIGCLFWRRNLKKKRKDADVEARSRRRRHRSSPTEEEVREMEMEREIKTKQKIWARATARWRANVRYSAHQRRGKRLSTRLSQAQQSTASLDNSRSRLAGSASSTHSRASSRRSSMSSIRDQPHHDHPPATMASTSQENLSRAETPRPVRPASPPAYQRGQIPPIVVSSDESTQSGLSTPAHLDRSRRPSHSSLYPSSAVSDDSQKAEHLFSVPTPIHAAHVATDDKSLLAQLADLASAPPEDTSANPAGTSEPQVSAPAWQDDEFEEYTPDADHDACTSDSQSSPPPLFPPPPSKERLAAAERYEYSFAFEELDSLGSEDEPSAPPFEEGCLPLIDESILLPSAPPLLDDDSGELPLNPIPSAPEWDSQTESLEPQEENVSGQDHDRMPSTSTNSPASGPTTSHPINEAVISERNGSTDTVMLPDYKP